MLHEKPEVMTAKNLIEGCLKYLKANCDIKYRKWDENRWKTNSRGNFSWKWNSIRNKCVPLHVGIICSIGDRGSELCSFKYDILECLYIPLIFSTHTHTHLHTHTHTHTHHNQSAVTVSNQCPIISVVLCWISFTFWPNLTPFSAFLLRLPSQMSSVVWRGFTAQSKTNQSPFTPAHHDGRQTKIPGVTQDTHFTFDWSIGKVKGGPHLHVPISFQARPLPSCHNRFPKGPPPHKRSKILPSNTSLAPHASTSHHHHKSKVLAVGPPTSSPSVPSFSPVAHSFPTLRSSSLNSFFS